jgi:thymidine kinase
MGSITLISGCMFSGKTTVLIREVGAAEQAGRRVAVFKHAVDRRYAGREAVTHNGARVAARAVKDSADVLAAAGPAEVVAIDEGHFFDDELPAVCTALRERGVDVIVTALDRTWRGEHFPAIQRLAELADRHEHVLAICARCGRPATVSQRIRPFERPGDFVGGAESYEPRCEECFVPGVDEHGTQ